MTKHEHSKSAVRVVVLGGSGFVGKALAETWPGVLNTSPTYLLHRSNPSWLGDLSVTARSVDLDEAADVARASQGHDVIINLLRPDGAGWYPELFARLKPAFQSTTISRCVHASSIDVYAGVRTNAIDENTLPHPISAYETEHCAAEQILAETFSDTVIMRLGAVFGVGGRNIVSLAKEMKDAPTWKLRLRRALYGDRRMHLVSVQTVASSLWSAALLPKSTERQLIIVTEDAEPENNFGFVQDRLAEAFRREGVQNTPTLPRIVLQSAMRMRGQSETSIDRRFSNRTMDLLSLGNTHFVETLTNYAHQLAASSPVER